MNGQGIGRAVKALREGERVRRRGWNGKGMFLVFVPGTEGVVLRAGTPYARHLGVGTTQAIGPHIDMYTAQGVMQPGWLASQADLLATDWELA